MFVIKNTILAQSPLFSVLIGIILSNESNIPSTTLLHTIQAIRGLYDA